LAGKLTSVHVYYTAALSAEQSLMLGAANDGSEPKITDAASCMSDCDGAEADSKR